MFAVMPAEKYLEDRPGSYVHIQWQMKNWEQHVRDTYYVNILIFSPSWPSWTMKMIFL